MTPRSWLSIGVMAFIGIVQLAIGLSLIFLSQRPIGERLLGGLVFGIVGLWVLMKTRAMYRGLKE
jgi:hypothetical protein